MGAIARWTDTTKSWSKALHLPEPRGLTTDECEACIPFTRYRGQEKGAGDVGSVLQSYIDISSVDSLWPSGKCLNLRTKGAGALLGSTVGLRLCHVSGAVHSTRFIPPLLRALSQPSLCRNPTMRMGERMRDRCRMRQRVEGTAHTRLDRRKQMKRTAVITICLPPRSTSI